MTIKTISTIFIAPTLNIPRKDKEENGYLNAYIKDSGREVNYEDAIYLLYQHSDMFKFKKFLDMEKSRTSQIIDDYDYDGGFVVVVYKLNPKFKKDFNIIKEGKYSTASESFKKLFPKVIKIQTPNGLHRDELALQYRIFNKTNDLVEFWEAKFGIKFEPNMEVWGGWNEEVETLNIEKVKKELYSASNTIVGHP